MSEAQSERFIWWRSKPYLLLTAITFMNFASTGISRPLFSLRAQDLGATLLQIGLIGTVGRIVVLGLQYLWGGGSDLLMRRKPLLMIGMAVSALTTWAVGLAGSWQPLSWIQGVAAFGTSAYSVGSLALIGDMLEGQANRGRLMGLHRGLGSLAFGIAALFGGSLADRYSTAAPFLVGGCFVAIGFILTCFLKEAPASAHAPSAVEAASQPAPDEGKITWAKLLWVLPFLAVVFAWFFAEASAFSFWPVYMVGKGLSMTVVTRLWGIAAIGETGAMVLAGYLSDRWGSKRVIGFGIAGMGLLFVGYTFASGLSLLIPMQLVRSVAYSCYSAAAMLYATEMGLRKQRGRMAGLQGTASSLGGIAGSVAGGGMSEFLGLETMLRAVGGLMALVGVIGGLKMRDPRKRE